MVYRVRAQLSGFRGGPGLNTFWFRSLTGGDPQAAAENAAQRVADFYGAIAVASTGLFYTTYGVTIEQSVSQLDSLTGELVAERSVTTTPTSVTGARVGSQGPNSCNLLLRLSTAGIVNGRAVKGRIYMGPCISSVDSDGTPPTALRSKLVADATTHLIDPHDDMLDQPALCVWARPFPGSPTDPNPRDGSQHVVDAVSCPDYWAIQRSRRD